MAGDFDEAALGAAIDAIEEMGFPLGVVATLRGLALAAGWGRDGDCVWPPSTIIQAGVSFRAGDRVVFEQDGRIYPSDQPYEAGRAVRDIREGEFVRYRPNGYWNGSSYERRSYEFG